ncbi:MAG: EF-hand domain-containing protein [Verrucomicrobiales bacterium]
MADRLGLLERAVSRYFVMMKYFLLAVFGFTSCKTVDPHSEAAHGRKVMALQEKFDRFDYDANGELSRREIEQGIRESGVTGVTAGEIDSLMKHYDVNGDGAISRWESQRAIDSPLPEQIEE